MARKKSVDSPKTKTATGSKTTRPWLGIIAIAVGVVLLAYLAYGIMLHFSDLTDGFTKFWTSLFYYPAANVFTKGYLGWTLLALLLPLLVVLSLGKIVWYGVKGKKLPTKNLIGLGVVLVIVCIVQYWVPPLTNSSVGYHEYVTRVDALDKLQQQQQQMQQGAPPTDKSVLHASALQQLVQGDIIRQVAVKLHVSVSNKEVNSFYKQLADQNQGEANFKKQLSSLLGWTPNQFKQEIQLRLLQEKISKKLADDKSLNKDRLKQAQDYLKQVQGGGDFGAIAKQAGAGGSSGQTAGDQPVSIKKGETDPAIESYAFKAKVGDVSGLIKTQTAYVIVKVTGQPSADEVQIQQISVPLLGVNEYFSQQLKDTNVSVYVHNLDWNKTLYTVQPKGGIPQQAQPQVQSTSTAAPAAGQSAAPAAPAAQQPAQ